MSRERSAQKIKNCIHLVGSITISARRGHDSGPRQGGGVSQGTRRVVLSQAEVVRRSALDVPCMP